MALVRRELKPAFLQSYFRFESPDQIPDHFDEWPVVPSYFGQWAVYGWSGGDQTTSFALDVTSLEQAELLANAKKKYFEETIKVYRYTNDIYIMSPDGNHQRYYMGHTI